MAFMRAGASTYIFRGIHTAKMGSVKVVIRLSPTKTWSFNVGGIEKLGRTLQFFSHLCRLPRNELVFRGNFQEITDDQSPFDLHWKGTANIDALCKTKTYCVRFRTMIIGAPRRFAQCLVLKWERLETVFAKICSTWHIQRDSAAFCIGTERVFGDHTFYSLHAQGSPTIWLILNPVDIHFRVNNLPGLLMCTIDRDEQLWTVLNEFCKMLNEARENVEFWYRSVLVRGNNTPRGLNMDRSVLLHYTVKMGDHPRGLAETYRGRQTAAETEHENS